MSTSGYVRFFEDFGIDDVPLVGGKNASLGEMFQKLSGQGVRVPHGFAITAAAYRHMLDEAGAWDRLHAELDDLDPADVAALARKAKRAREIVYGAGLPDDLAAEILDAYRALQREYGEEVSLAVRSSATAEDLPTASFAGQQDSYLNIKGDESLLDTCRRCFASLFTDRAIHYRIDQGFDHFKVSLSIGVMKMVRSDISSSGVMFSLDTESGFRDAVFVTGAYGLGENVVQGAVDPDEYYVHKPTYLAGHRAVLRRLLGDKAVKMILVEGETKNTTRNIPTPKADRARFCLTDADVLELAGYACAIEEHYGRPMDMEWAKDGIDGKLYIVQARPETVASQHSVTALETYVLEGRGEVLAEGRSVGERIASGAVKRIENLTQLAEFKPGEVLVADTTTPDWEPVMKTAAAIVTNRGGRTCHASIIARELGIPAVVGTGDATTCVPDGAVVTVSCAEGDSGRVYDGAVGFHVDRTEVGDIAAAADADHAQSRQPRPRLQDVVPAERRRRAGPDGVHHQRVHQGPPAGPAAPRAGRRPRGAPDDRSAHPGLPDGSAFFVERLSEGIGTIAAAFWPKPVVVRMSDFKTNEYASLLGGAGLRAVREQPDDRLPRRLALRAPRLRRGLRAGVPRDAARARRDGPDERHPHAPVRAPGRRGGPRPADDGRPRPEAGRERAQGVRDVRDPEQRDPDR